MFLAIFMKAWGRVGDQADVQAWSGDAPTTAGGRGRGRRTRGASRDGGRTWFSVCSGSPAEIVPKNRVAVRVLQSMRDKISLRDYLRVKNHKGFWF